MTQVAHNQLVPVTGRGHLRVEMLPIRIEQAPDSPQAYAAVVTSRQYEARPASGVTRVQGLFLSWIQLKTNVLPSLFPQRPTTGPPGAS